MLLSGSRRQSPVVEMFLFEKQVTGHRWDAHQNRHNCNKSASTLVEVVKRLERVTTISLLDHRIYESSEEYGVINYYFETSTSLTNFKLIIIGRWPRRLQHDNSDSTTRGNALFYLLVLTSQPRRPFKNFSCGMPPTRRQLVSIRPWWIGRGRTILDEEVICLGRDSPRWSWNMKMKNYGIYCMTHWWRYGIPPRHRIVMVDWFLGQKNMTDSVILPGHIETDFVPYKIYSNWRNLTNSKSSLITEFLDINNGYRFGNNWQGHILFHIENTCARTMYGRGNI